MEHYTPSRLKVHLYTFSTIFNILFFTQLYTSVTRYKFIKKFNNQILTDYWLNAPRKWLIITIYLIYKLTIFFMYNCVKKKQLCKKKVT